MAVIIAGSGQRDTMFHWLNETYKFPKGTAEKPLSHQAMYMQVLCAIKKLGGAENSPTPRQENKWYI